MEISVEFLKNSKMKLPYDPAMPLLNIYPKESKSAHNNRHTSMFTIALFTIVIEISLNVHQQMNGQRRCSRPKAVAHTCNPITQKIKVQDQPGQKVPQKAGYGDTQQSSQYVG
jgi:hypothetical protein